VSHGSRADRKLAQTQQLSRGITRRCSFRLARMSVSYHDNKESAKATWQSRYLARFYSPPSEKWDGTRKFYHLCARALTLVEHDTRQILEVGAGPSNQSSRYLASLGSVTGLDPDPLVRTNDALTRSVVLRDQRYPFPDSCFDLAVSDYVVEHLRDPLTHLSELYRVLKVGGSYVFRTPNRFHYVPLVASLTPHWFHEAVANRARGIPPEAHSPYPTVYAMNTARSIGNLARSAGFTVEGIDYIEGEPWYGMFSRLAFLVMMGYERLVNSTELFAPARANLFVVLRKL
jgi:SAM-dependent methyltransferase